MLKIMLEYFSFIDIYYYLRRKKVANIKSAKKRIDTIKRQRDENRLIKSTLSTSIKKFKKLLTSNELEKAEAQLKETISLIDKAQSKGVLHKNNASNKVAKLSGALDKFKKKASQEKVEVNEAVAVKAEAKEVVAEEEAKPAKKTTTKKATTTKTTTTKKVAPKEAKEETSPKKTTRKSTKKEA